MVGAYPNGAWTKEHGYVDDTYVVLLLPFSTTNIFSSLSYSNIGGGDIVKLYYRNSCYVDSTKNK
jgi:hypothetical protein